MSLILRIVAIVCFLGASIARGAILRHAVMETDTAESLQMGRVCYGLLLEADELLCAPRGYLIEPSGGLRMDARLKANDRAFVVASRVLDQDMDAEFLDGLFKEDSFQSVSGAASVEARYKGTSFAYTPIHAVGAMTIDNPSLPEIHVAGARQSVLRLTQNVVLGEPHDARVVLSPSVFYYERELAYLDGDLLTASGRPVDSLIEKEATYKVDGDLAVALLPGMPFVPSVTLRTENLGSKDACPGCDERPIEIAPLFGRRAHASLAFDVAHPVGHSVFGLGLPFWGVFHRLDKLETTAAYTYKIGSLGSFAAFSPMISSFGFLFDADFYRMGIRYTDEKQDASLRIKRLKQVYVFAGFAY